MSTYREGRRWGAVGDCRGSRERSHWRHSCHHKRRIGAKVEGIVVGNELEVEKLAPRRLDLVTGL